MRRLFIFSLLCFLICHSSIAQNFKKNNYLRDTFLFDTVDNIKIFTNSDTSILHFSCGMRIDADGSPRAYCPEDTGIDFLKNAGKPGNWWGIICDINGKPFIQKQTDPNPGYYISCTSLFDKTSAINDPSRYVNSDSITYIALPKSLMKKADIKLGDYCLVQRDSFSTMAMVADTGPEGKLGEGSIFLANKLHIPSNPKNGGIETGLKYTLFTKSGKGNGCIPSLKELDNYLLKISN